MKNAKKIVSITLCAVIMVLVFATAVSAAEATPYYNNFNSAMINFRIEDGIATATVDYSGLLGITSKVTIKCTIEKRSFLFFWSDVYEHKIVTLNGSGTEIFEYQVSPGTYRATIECTFSGTGGADDVVTKQLTASY